MNRRLIGPDFTVFVDAISQIKVLTLINNSTKQTEFKVVALLNGLHYKPEGIDLNDPFVVDLYPDTFKTYVEALAFKHGIDMYMKNVEDIALEDLYPQESAQAEPENSDEEAMQKEEKEVLKESK